MAENTPIDKCSVALLTHRDISVVFFSHFVFRGC